MNQDKITPSPVETVTEETPRVTEEARTAGKRTITTTTTTTNIGNKTETKTEQVKKTSNGTKTTTTTTTTTTQVEKKPDLLLTVLSDVVNLIADGVKSLFKRGENKEETTLKEETMTKKKTSSS
mmetsp:Transcript_11207/g.15529  ORF Transcript_11207/g.15529 Transcript_11207/m.15529 type:complete len:124 (-) Transcript_11207:286-657(-)|eukprot:CAMPEP_0185727000 /NCGR_PEP_ID=MMETSP1171-20130828/2813_1 /TAXON_ID=374046 /ORGANISM="Helicotheca tamensis, Strain CCMP826" /LENGTH=123 /DNA_ID=CAMNT_0028395465 /DNA_START=84 /DNA_END=455 /DNA_ORIENTATION=-